MGEVRLLVGLKSKPHKRRKRQVSDSFLCGPLTCLSHFLSCLVLVICCYSDKLFQNVMLSNVSHFTQFLRVRRLSQVWSRVGQSRGQELSLRLWLLILFGLFGSIAYHLAFLKSDDEKVRSVGVWRVVEESFEKMEAAVR